MKKIVRELAEDQISINAIEDSDFIGIDWNENNHKAIVIRDNKGFASFTFTPCMPDLRNVWYTNTAKEYVNKALSQRSEVKAYKFETSEELITWLNQ
jgi:hypothetical protein